jgi:hypothetical protein
VAPSVEVAVDGAWRQASRVLGDDHLGAAFIQLSDGVVQKVPFPGNTGNL